MGPGKGFTRCSKLFLIGTSKQSTSKIVSKFENFTNSLSAKQYYVQIKVLEAAECVFKIPTENLPILRRAKK